MTDHGKAFDLIDFHITKGIKTKPCGTKSCDILSADPYHSSIIVTLLLEIKLITKNPAPRIKRRIGKNSETLNEQSNFIIILKMEKKLTHQSGT